MRHLADLQGWLDDRRHGGGAARAAVHWCAGLQVTYTWAAPQPTWRRALQTAAAFSPHPPRRRQPTLTLLIRRATAFSMPRASSPRSSRPGRRMEAYGKRCALTVSSAYGCV